VILFILFTGRKNLEKVSIFYFRNFLISVLNRFFFFLTNEDVAFKFEYKNEVDSNTKNRLIDFAATQIYNFDDFQDFDSGEKLEREEKKELTDEAPKDIENENLEKKKTKADDDLDEENSNLSKKIKLDEKVEKKMEEVNRNNDLSDIMNCAICDEIMHDCIW
jgi:hypothetical protein